MSSLPKSFKPARTAAYKDHLTPWRPEFSVLLPSFPVHYSEFKQVMNSLGELTASARKEAAAELRSILYVSLAVEKAQRAAKDLPPKDYGQFPDGL